MSERWEDFDDEAFDEELSEMLHRALDAEGPSPEAEERMLANLLAAQKERMAQEAEVEAAGAENPDIERFDLPEVTSKEGFELVEGYGKRRSRKRRRVAGLAVAASIIVALVGVGLSLRANKAESSAASEAMYEAEASKSEETTGADNVIVMHSNAVAESAAPSEDEELAPEMDSMGGSFVEGDALVSELEAMGGSFDVTADPSYELACRYQLIRLDGQFDLRIEEHAGAPVLIDQKWEEGLVGEAIAYNEDDESDSVPCWVHLLPVSDDGLYVVRYIEDGSLYAARVIREESE